MKKNNRLHKTILIIANEINKICKKHGIDYFIDGGTLLGAVRHGGFIPWDDDFDIGMKRNDFDKFLDVCKEELDCERFYLETSMDCGYAFEFAKIHLNGTEIIEDFSKNANVHHGIFIDIFPYDKVPNSYLLQKVFLFKNKIIKNIIWNKLNYGTYEQRKKISNRIFKFIGNLIPTYSLKDFRNRFIQKYNSSDSMTYFTSDYPNILLNEEWLQCLVDYEFEEYKFIGVKNFDSYLHNLYGDYMSIPPEDQRVVHSDLEIDFGDY